MEELDWLRGSRLPEMDKLVWGTMRICQGRVSRYGKRGLLGFSLVLARISLFDQMS